ncbi:hypothetical protein BpHYR1_017719 [Brachionus plicatilis]|uniref:Uncharacterized protein n=1 Tax=Brachionus plicatilis TaxID=10195 RepID=A0A3M7T1I1_BRAPC|nr:hypothetical protein BpHYR1_017719 [Brachionus plicatilis]
MKERAEREKNIVCRKIIILPKITYESSIRFSWICIIALQMPKMCQKLPQLLISISLIISSLTKSLIDPFIFVPQKRLIHSINLAFFEFVGVSSCVPRQLLSMYFEVLSEISKIHLTLSQSWSKSKSDFDLSLKLLVLGSVQAGAQIFRPPNYTGGQKTPEEET